jgi:hypothetical protein
VLFLDVQDNLRKEPDELRTLKYLLQVQKKHLGDTIIFPSHEASIRATNAPSNHVSG